jgi:hypothetical protein
MSILSRLRISAWELLFDRVNTRIPPLQLLSGVGLANMEQAMSQEKALLLNTEIAAVVTAMRQNRAVMSRYHVSPESFSAKNRA